MSFSSETKQEIARIKTEKRCCGIAETAGFICASGAVTLSGKGRVGLLMATEHPAVARRIKTVIAGSFGISAMLMVGEPGFNRSRHVFEVKIPPERGAERVLRETGVMTGAETGINIHGQVDARFMMRKCCRKACLRGFFLGAGTVNEPDKGYNLEIVLSDEQSAAGLRRLINSFSGIHAHVRMRRGKYVVYLKDSEQIKDILNILGAHTQLLKFENTRILKEVRNLANRLSNCDNANMDKSLRAADRQIGDIRCIQSATGLDELPDDLLDTALARLSRPEANMAEIGEMLSPPIGKAAVAARFRRIAGIASATLENEDAPKSGTSSGEG